MNTHPGLERCLTYFNAQLQPPRAAFENAPQKRAVTISRQTGSGGHAVGEILAAFLQARAPKGACPWTVFDRNLVEKVIEDHHLPKHLTRFMTEDRISELADTMDELFGLHPPSWTLVRKTTETMLHLVELGNVILIGRGANVITASMDTVFHVRLVGSLEKRCDYVQKTNHLSHRAALDLIRREDRGRQRYLKKYFGQDIENPLLYHMVINTDFVPYADAARMIADEVLPKAVEVQRTN